MQDSSEFLYVPTQYVLCDLKPPWEIYLTTWRFQRLDVDLEQRFIHWMLLFWSSAMHPTKNCARIGSSVHLHYLACSLLQSCLSVFCMEMG